MKKILTLLFLIISLLGFSESAHASANVVGRVTDAITGQPIQGALVQAIHSGQAFFSTFTNANGEYTFSGIQPRPYSFVASSAGYQQQAIGLKPNNNATSTLNFRLRSNGGTIQGTVIDSSTTNPISGATIKIYQGNTLISTTTTNGSGFYSVSNLLAPNSYVVIATATGYHTKSQGVLLSVGGTTTANFSLEPTPGTLSGTVKDSLTNLPIANASVLVYSGTTLVATGNTDNSGLYTIPDLTPGFYTVRAEALNYQVRNSGAGIDTASTTILDFLLDPQPGTLTGKITSSLTHLPIAGASVEIWLGQSQVASALTDPGGNYTIISLPPGQYTIITSATNFQTKSVGTAIQSNVTTTQNISLVPNPGSLSGQITDSSTLLPLVGATINIFQGQTLVASTLTDSSGNYAIKGLAPGSYTVVVSLTDYQTNSVGAIISSGVNTTENLALTPNPGEITGFITDAITTNPIEGALVYAYKGTVQIAFALTDPTGKYTFPNLEPGQYTVFATKPDYQTKLVGATVTASLVTFVSLALNPQPGSIQGTVSAGLSNAPIAGAVVEVYSGTKLLGSTLTDSHGNYTLSGLSAGSYKVVAKASNYQSSTLGAIVTSNATTTVNFTLNPEPGSLSGTVTDATNPFPPIPNTLILVFDVNGFVDFATTDTNGNYQVPGLAPGEYIVLAVADNFQIGIIGAIIVSNSNTIVDFSLSPDPGTLSGTITDSVSTNPIPGATVEVLSGSILIASGITDNAGQYTIPSLPPGNYVVKASAANYQSQTIGSTIISNSTTAQDFALKPNPGDVIGSVKDAMTGDPIAGALVRVFSGSTFLTSVVTDSNGNYLITGLAPGQYILTGSKTNYQTLQLGVTVISNAQAVANFNLTPDPGIVLGSVRDGSNNNPISGASVMVRNGPVLIGSAVTDSSGNYQISNLPPGVYSVTATAANYQLSTQTSTIISKTTTTANFLLQPTPGVLTGTVQSSAGGNPPIPNAEIYVYQGSQLVAYGLTNSTGTYLIPILASGSYNIVVTASAFQTTTSTELISAGATTIANYLLDPNPGSVSGTITEACTGGAVPGALVLVLDGDIIFGFDVTDNSGNYFITNLAPGSYSILVGAHNFIDASGTVTIVSNVQQIMNFLLTPEALPPSSISGKVIKNKYVSTTDRVHYVQWTASPGLCVQSYRLYRNGRLIAVINPHAPLEYYDHCRNKKTDVYTVEAVNIYGGVSTPVFITLK